MEWNIFLLACLWAIFILYIPGYIITRGCGVRRSWAVSLAPLVGAGIICVVGEISFRMHIAITPLILNSICLFVACLFLAGVRLYSHVMKCSLPSCDLPSIHPLIPLAYVVCGVCAAWVLFISQLAHPSDLNLAWDMSQHLNATRTMLTEGIFSSFHTSAYVPSELAYAPWDISHYGLYPATWNIYCASVSYLAHVDIPTASNALNMVVCALVSPLSLMGALRYILHEAHHDILDSRLVTAICLMGALTSSIFIIFPWSNLVFGPIFPYVFGLSLTPALLWLIMYTLTQAHNNFSRFTRILMHLLAIGCVCSLLFVHPSCVFSFIVFITPWYVHTLLKARKYKQTLLFLIIFIGIWTLLWFLIVRHGILSGFYWPGYTDLHGALRSVLGMSFVSENYPDRMIQIPQPTLTLFVLVGIWVSIRKIKAPWISMVWLWCASLCVYTTVVDIPGKKYFTGFWYTDPQRLGANAGVISIILAALGAGYIAYMIARIIFSLYTKLHKVQHKELPDRAMQAQSLKDVSRILPTSLVSIVGVLVASLIIFGVATIHLSSTIYDVAAPALYQRAVSNEYTKSNILSHKELSFLTRVQNILEERGYSPIISNPYDGSVVAYGVMGLPCVYRHPFTFHQIERKETELLRQNLVNYHESPEVRSALQKTGIRYVLRLEDIGHVTYPQNYHTWQYAGIDKINDTTPGFRILAAEGAMRLYEISDE